MNGKPSHFRNVLHLGRVDIRGPEDIMFICHVSVRNWLEFRFELNWGAIYDYMNYSKDDANTENRKEEWTHLSGAILKAFDLYLSQGPYLSLFSPFSFIGRSLKTQVNYSTHLVVVFDSLKIWHYHNIRWSIVFLSCYSHTWTDSMCMEILRVFSGSNEISYFIFVLWAQPWPSPSRSLSY